MPTPGPLYRNWISVPATYRSGRYGSLIPREDMLLLISDRTSQKVILIVFSCFLQDLCEYVRHCNKIHIFLLSPFPGVPIIAFTQLRKMIPALAFNFIIVATNVWRGKWNRHAGTPSDIFFVQVIFCIIKKNAKKIQIDCVHYEKVLEAIINFKAVRTEKCGNITGTGHFCII